MTAPDHRKSRIEVHSSYPDRLRDVADSLFHLSSSFPTASTSNISYALCQEFSRKNCIVYATARRLAAIESLPQSVHKVALDVLDVESCRAAVDQVIAEQGKIDVLVNNAGAGGTGAVLDADVESDEGAKATVRLLLAESRSVNFCRADERSTKLLRAQFETNVWAPIRLCKLVVPHMIEKRSGLVINIGSIVGNVATPWSGIYSASKSALHSLTETLRMEVKGFGVKVMLVAPGEHSPSSSARGKL